MENMEDMDMQKYILETSDLLGQKAAAQAEEILNEAIQEHGRARIILSTGGSQFNFLKYFVLTFEQTMFGFSNFFYLAVIARRLTLNDFAELSLGYTCYLFLIGIHHSLICDPIIAFGNRVHDDPKALLRRLWMINVTLGGSVLALGCVLAAISEEHERSAFTIAALACLFFSCAGLDDLPGASATYRWPIRFW